MADIQLTADGSQALATLKKIQDSVDKLGGEFKKFAGDASKSLDSVKKNTENLSNATAMLGKAVGALGMAGIIKNFGDYSKEVVNANKATGVAISTIDNFAKAVGKAGGDSSRAVGDVIDFTASLKEANDGSVGAQAELERMGITLKDLGTLSNEDIFKKTINGLAGIGDASDRNALALKYFGRNFKDIDFKTVAATFGQSQASGKDNSQSIQRMADAMDSLNIMFSSIKAGILEAFDPVIKVFKFLTENVKGFTDTLKEMAKLATLAGLAFLWIDKVSGKFNNLAANLDINKQLTSLKNKTAEYEALITKMGSIPESSPLSKKMDDLDAGWERAKAKEDAFIAKHKETIQANEKLSASFTAMKQVVTSPFTGLASSLDGVKNGIGTAVNGFSEANKAGEANARVMSKLDNFHMKFAGTVMDSAQSMKFARIQSGLYATANFYATKSANTLALAINGVKVAAASTIAVLGNMIAIFGILYTAAEALNWLINKIFDVDVLKNVSEWFDEVTGAAERARKKQKEVDDAAKDKAEEEKRIVVNKLWAETNAAINENIRSYAQQNQMNNEQLAHSIKMIGLSEDRIQTETESFNLQQEYKKKIQDSNNEIAKQFDLLKGLKPGTEDYKRANAEIDKQRQIQGGVTKEYEKQAATLPKLQADRTIAVAKERDRQHILEEITKQMERQATLGDQLRGANDKMVDINFQESLRGKSPLEKQMMTIKEDARKAALEAGRAFAAGFEDSGDGLTPEKANELKVGLDKIAKSYKAIADEQVKNLKISRTWQAGWDEAFNAYADSATNAAKMAGDAFNAVTNSMNQAIDNFVMTGKFSFKDMATSIIQDLIKIELKAQAMDIWKMMRGGSSSGGGSVIGTLWDWGKSILGFANGGEPPVGVPSLVGENGPELFIPKSAGTVIPNGGGGKSFDLGTTAKMSAPRPSPSVTRVTNNSTQNTYVTNSISAVDAQSVAQLLMSNKNTIFGIVQQAQKGLPR
jgi:phage-related minor tail protein